MLLLTIVFVTMLLGFSEWFIIKYSWTDFFASGEISQFFVVADFAHTLFLMTIFAEIAVLLSFMTARSRMEKIIMQNIYLAILFLLVVAAYVEWS